MNFLHNEKIKRKEKHMFMFEKCYVTHITWLDMVILELLHSSFFSLWRLLRFVTEAIESVPQGLTGFPM